MKKIKDETKIKIKKIFKTILEFIMVAVGCFFMALSFNVFCIPHQIAPGGFSGLAAVLYFLTGFPAGISNFLLCLPWFFVLLKSRGYTPFFKSIFGTGMFSLFIELTSNFPSVVDDIFLASLCGGIIMGFGIAIIFAFKGTTGGTDLLASLMHSKFTELSVGAWLLIIDCSVVLFAGIVLKEIEVSLYSAITVYVCMKIIELAQNGFNYNKAFYIITKKPDEIKHQIFEKLDRGVTFLNAKGGFSGNDQDILLCVVSRLQISELKSIIKNEDPEAFVFIADVNEVFGEGFDTN